MASDKWTNDNGQVSLSSFSKAEIAKPGHAKIKLFITWWCARVAKIPYTFLVFNWFQVRPNSLLGQLKALKVANNGFLVGSKTVSYFWLGKRRNDAGNKLFQFFAEHFYCCKIFQKELLPPPF